MADLFIDHIKTEFPPNGEHAATVDEIKANITTQIESAKGKLVVVTGKADVAEEDYDYWRFGVTNEWWRDALGFTDAHTGVTVTCTTKRPMNRRVYELSVTIVYNA